MRCFIMFLLLLSANVYASDRVTKLFVGITLNNFYPEWLDMYEDQLSEGGFKRLINSGQKVNVDYNYLYSQSGVDHASIYSGLLPAEHGIVSHSWYDRLKKKRIDNVTNNNYRSLGISDVGLAPDKLHAITLSSAMKLNNSFSKVYSIGVNGEETVLSGGSNANMALWISDKTGKWISSSYYLMALPSWVIAYNKALDLDVVLKKGWIPLRDEETNSISAKVKRVVGTSNTFFYDLMQSQRRYNTYKILKATPYINAMVADMAKKVITEEKLGVDNDVDFLAINFSCLDYMNRDYKIKSMEFQDLLLRLDKELELLFAELDKRVGEGKYTICMTFSESRELLPEEFADLRMESGYFEPFKAGALLKSYLNVNYGVGEWIIDYDASQIYLNRELISERKIPLQEIQNKVAAFLIEFEGIDRVVTSYSMTYGSAGSGVETQFHNSFSQKRSGDVFYSLQKTWLHTLDNMEDFYTRYSKRHTFPCYFYGADVDDTLYPEMQVTELLPIFCKIVDVPCPYTAN